MLTAGLSIPLRVSQSDANEAGGVIFHAAAGPRLPAVGGTHSFTKKTRKMEKKTPQTLTREKFITFRPVDPSRAQPC